LIILPASAAGSIAFSPSATILSFHTDETVSFSVDTVLRSMTELFIKRNPLDT